MTDHDLTGTGGNIFARKLENILNAHHSQHEPTRRCWYST